MTKPIPFGIIVRKGKMLQQYLEFTKEDRTKYSRKDIINKYINDFAEEQNVNIFSVHLMKIVEAV